MRFAVLAAPDSWYYRDLVRAGGDRHEIAAVPFSQIAADLGGASERVTSAGHDLSQCDAVLVRTMPPGTLEQVVFRMDALARLEAGGAVVVNPPRSLEVAVDKFLASARLQAAGLATPRTCVSQSVEQAMADFESLGGDVVVKPLFGSEGRGLVRLTDESLAWRTFKTLAGLGAVLYLQEFIEHEGCDLRVLLIGEKALAMRRRNHADWRTNISRGASAEPFEPNEELVAIAGRAAEAVGAPLVGVDLLPARNGTLYVLEVNAVPGWRGLARATGLDVAALVWSYVESQVVERRRKHCK
jgi:ribosomal protein S6--L-glutamate ligase